MRSWILFACAFLFFGISIIKAWVYIHSRNDKELKADLIELVIASDPTLSSEEIKHRVNDLYKFIVEDENEK